MNAAQLINQDSGIKEYFTPQNIIEAARVTMGNIDLDPASSFYANLRVAADGYFTKEQNGLSMEWHGRVWMNHPFNKKTNAQWINKLESEYTSGRVTEACCITFASTSEKWFQPLLRRPQCFLVPRTSYVLPNGTTFKGATKGSVVTYFGKRPSWFAHQFRSFGVVKVACDESVHKLAVRLSDALDHVGSCQQCCEADWRDCDTGGKEAHAAKMEARKIL